MTTGTRPLRLTPPQLDVLAKLKAGWRCETAGRLPPTFYAPLWYPFEQGDQVVSFRGATLAKLARLGLIAWEAVILPSTTNGSTVSTFQLVLTPAGLAVLDG